MDFSALLYLKALKALKAHRRKKILAASRAKNIKSEILCALISALFYPLNPPEGDTSLSKLPTSAPDPMIFEKRFKVGRIPSRVFGNCLRASLSHALADTVWGNRTPTVSGRFFSDDD